MQPTHDARASRSHQTRLTTRTHANADKLPSSTAAGRNSTSGAATSASLPRGTGRFRMNPKLFASLALDSRKLRPDDRARRRAQPVRALSECRLVARPSEHTTPISHAGEGAPYFGRALVKAVSFTTWGEARSRRSVGSRCPRPKVGSRSAGPPFRSRRTCGVHPLSSRSLHAARRRYVSFCNQAAAWQPR